MIEKLIECIDDEIFTGHMLKDILCTNFSFDKIKAAIEMKNSQLRSKESKIVKSIQAEPEIEKEETEKEKKKRIGIPSQSIEELLKEFNSE